MLLNKKTQISIYTLNQLMSVNFHIGDKTYKWNILIKNLLFDGRHGVYYFNLKKTFLLLTSFLYFFNKTMESYKLLLLINKQDLNFLNDWYKLEMFRKIIKSIEETSFSLRKLPKPPGPLNNNVFNPTEYQNILKSRFANINKHEVKLTGFQCAQLLIEK